MPSADERLRVAGERRRLEHLPNQPLDLGRRKPPRIPASVMMSSTVRPRAAPFRRFFTSKLEARVVVAEEVLGRAPHRARGARDLEQAGDGDGERGGDAERERVVEEAEVVDAVGVRWSNLNRYCGPAMTVAGARAPARRPRAPAASVARARRETTREKTGVGGRDGHAPTEGRSRRVAENKRVSPPPHGEGPGGAAALHDATWRGRGRGDRRRPSAGRRRAGPPVPLSSAGNFFTDRRRSSNGTPGARSRSSRDVVARSSRGASAAPAAPRPPYCAVVWRSQKKTAEDVEHLDPLLRRANDVPLDGLA